MRFIAAVLADMMQSPLGTPSRLAEPLCGVPVLRRTLSRLLRASQLDEVCLIVPVSQVECVRPLIQGLANPQGRSVQVETIDTDTPAGSVWSAGPFAELVRTGRWWGLDAWRGGVGALCAFDEDLNLPALAACAHKYSADAVVAVPAAAALIDPALTDAMIAHYERAGHALGMTFTQAPPGLAPLIIGRTLLDQLAPNNEPIGLLLTYNPDRPVPDLTGKEACFRAPAGVIEASGRLLCDTPRSFDRVRQLIEAGGEDWGAEPIGAWLQDRCQGQVEPIPAEIEIELTTDGLPAGGSLLRPGPSETGRRGPVSLDAIRAIVDVASGSNDIRIVLAGPGDPCLHPGFGEITRMLRTAAAAIAVRTYARFPLADGHAGFDESQVEDALFETPVDVIEVPVDAATAKTYQLVHGVDAFGEVTARIEKWLERRVARRRARPLVVPSFVKCNENLDEMEAFFDSWQRRLGMVLVTGHSDFAGQRPRRCVTSMAPPHRGVCRRTLSRMRILADGTVTTCDQDYRGVQTVGRLPDVSLADAWHAPRLVQIRGNDFSTSPLCPKCDEWHRP